VTQAHRATGEALLVPLRNQRSRVGRITGDPGKSADGERVADGPVLALKRGNTCGAKGPCWLHASDNMGGRGAKIMASISLQDLRRRLYVMAKAEKDWRCNAGTAAGRDGVARRAKVLPGDRSHNP
jgi:hypothetical protein